MCACSVAQSCPVLCVPMDFSLAGSCPWNFPGNNTGMGYHFLLQGRPRDQTCVSCIGKWILSHWAIKEALAFPSASVQLLSCVWLLVTPWTAACQAFLSITNSWSLLKSCLSSQWSHPIISSFVVPFSSCLQSFPASESFLMNQLFASGGQSTEASSSATVLPMNIWDWLPLGLTGLTSLQSKGLSRVFSNTTVQKHQFFGA